MREDSPHNGHSSISSTMIYAHFLPTDWTEGMKRMPDPFAVLKQKQEVTEP